MTIPKICLRIRRASAKASYEAVLVGNGTAFGWLEGLVGKISGGWNIIGITINWSFIRAVTSLIESLSVSHMRSIESRHLKESCCSSDNWAEITYSGSDLVHGFRKLCCIISNASSCTGFEKRLLKSSALNSDIDCGCAVWLTLKSDPTARGSACIPEPEVSRQQSFADNCSSFKRTVPHFLQEASAGVCVRLRFMRGTLPERAARTTRDVGFFRSLQVHL